MLNRIFKQNLSRITNSIKKINSINKKETTGPLISTNECKIKINSKMSEFIKNIKPKLTNYLKKLASNKSVLEDIKEETKKYLVTLINNQNIF